MSIQLLEGTGSTALLENPETIHDLEIVNEAREIIEAEHDRLDKIEEIIDRNDRARALLVDAARLRASLDSPATENSPIDLAKAESFTHAFDTMEQEGLDSTVLEYILEIAYPAAPRVGVSEVPAASQSDVRVESTPAAPVELPVVTQPEVKIDAPTTQLAETSNETTERTVVRTPASHADDYHFTPQSQPNVPRLTSGTSVEDKVDSGTVQEKHESFKFWKVPREEWKNVHRPSFWAARWNTKKDLMMWRGIEGDMSEEDSQKIRDKNRLKYMMARGVILVAAAGAAYDAFDSSADGTSLSTFFNFDSDTTSAAELVSPSVADGNEFSGAEESNNVSEKWDALPLETPPVVEANPVPIPEKGIGGDEFLSSLSIPEGTWDAHRDEMYDKFGPEGTKDLYEMLDGSLGINETFSKPLSTELQTYITNTLGKSNG